MTKNEIENIKKKFEEWKLKGDKSFPSFLLYSKCFLSFSKDENQILKYMGNKDEKFHDIVLILKNNYNISNKYSSNVDIEFLSANTQEREVLFFPYSTFCLENIYKGEYKTKKCVIINLEYLGKYSNIFNNIKNDANFKKNLVNFSIIKIIQKRLLKVKLYIQTFLILIMQKKKYLKK